MKTSTQNMTIDTQLFFRDSGITTKSSINEKKREIKTNQGKIALIKDINYPEKAYLLCRIRGPSSEDFDQISYCVENLPGQKNLPEPLTDLVVSKTLYYNDLAGLIVENR